MEVSTRAEQKLCVLIPRINRNQHLPKGNQVISDKQERDSLWLFLAPLVKHP